MTPIMQNVTLVFVLSLVLIFAQVTPLGTSFPSKSYKPENTSATLFFVRMIIPSHNGVNAFSFPIPMKTFIDNGAVHILFHSGYLKTLKL